MNLQLPGEKGVGRDRFRYGIDMHILLYLKWTTNKDLVYSTKNTVNIM